MPVSIQTPIVTYTANGSVRSFAFNFRILKASDLHVFVAGVDTSSGYTIAGIGHPNGGSVDFDVAPAGGIAVRLQRITSLDRATDYVEGGQLAADTLDNDFDRVVMMIQDINNAPMLEGGDGKFDAEGKAIKNVATPVDAGDVTNKAYVDQFANGVIANAISAVNTATAAASDASASASNALGHLNTFKGQYYGAFATNPTLDPLGNPMTIGDLYFNTTTNGMFVYSGTAWQTVAPIVINPNPTVGIVAAAGTTQGTAAGLASGINVVTSSTPGINDGVILPAATAGLTINVMNVTTEAINVYPGTGAAIDGYGSNVAVNLGSGAKLVFVAVNSAQWYPMTAVYA